MLSSLLSLPCFLLLQGAEAAFPVGQAALELVGFLAWFGVFGALGFHFFVLGRTAGLRPAAGAADAGIPLLADRRAARVGLAGALLLLVSLVADAAGQAAEKHRSLGAVIQRGGPALPPPPAR